MYTCSMVKTLMQLKDVTKEDAKLIREIWLSDNRDFVYDFVKQFDKQTRLWNCKTRELKRRAIDHIINTYGVEYLGQHQRNGEYVYYCNAGDTYARTILFMGQRLVVGCWGDLVERNLIKEPEQY